MRKLAITTGVLLFLFILLAFVLPAILKPKIKQAIDEALVENINANVYYDEGSFSLSFLRDFPNLTVSISNSGITGFVPFEGDTLVHVNQFNLTLNLMSIINGSQIEIENILLDNMILNILVLADGSSNYDITFPAEEAITDTSTAQTSILIKRWELKGADIVYYDQTLPFYTTLFDMQHVGSGTFTGDIFSMKSESSVGSFSMAYDDTEYITNKKLDAKVEMEMDLEKFKFTFKENVFNLNALPFTFDGYIEMPGEDIAMDLNFGGKSLDIKSLLSLTPGDYEAYLKGVSASGDFNLGGYIRGIYNDSLMPAFNINMEVVDGKVAYVDSPVPIENLNVKMVVDIPGADWTLASFSVSPFSMTMQNEPFSATILVEDFENYRWDMTAKGSLDFEKITKIFPIDSTKLLGKLTLDLQTKGNYAAVENEKYDQLPTSGRMALKDFALENAAVPQGVSISNASVSFDPKSINLTQLIGKAGKSDFNLSGTISNYIAYALNDSAVLAGSFSLNSTLLDINELMAGEETEADTAALEAIRIPQNIEFLFSASITQIIFDDMIMDNFTGSLLVKDGAIDMKKTGFSILGGKIEMTGMYNSLPEQPVYDFDMAIKDMEIAAAFKSFNTMRKLAPFAEKMSGAFSTNFKVNGFMDNAMNPIYETMNGIALINVARAALQDVKLLSAISAVTSLKSKDGGISMKDVLMNMTIENGIVNMKPFDVVLGGYTTTIEGSNTISGKLFYAMKVKNVETGGVGQALSATLGSLTGTKGLISDKIDVNLGVEGDFTKPQVKLLGISPAGSTGGKSTMTDAAKDALAQKLNAEKAALNEKLNETKADLKDSANAVLDQTKEQAKEAVNEEIDKAKEKATDAAKKLLKKKGTNK